jgi:subtilisin-like proprotein convertase family protein
LPLAIPDNDLEGVSADIVVDGSLDVDDLNVRLDITHSWVGDLVVRLTHVETGHTAVLVDRPGIPATTTGCSQPDIAAILDDEAPAAAEDQCSPGLAIDGTYRPNQALSAFDGDNAAGTWRLTVVDGADDDTGSLDAWCLGVNRPPGGE